MKAEIIEKVENPLLKRTEIKFKVDHAGAPTPKRLEVRPRLAEMLGAEEDLVVIEKLAGTHGRQVSSGIACVYTSKEQLDKVGSKYLLQRSLPKERTPEKSPEEKPRPEKAKPPKEAKPEEKPKGAKQEKVEPKKEIKSREKPKPEEEKRPKEAKPEEKKTEGKGEEKPLMGEDKGGRGK